jgi:hypothetical protein
MIRRAASWADGVLPMRHTGPPHGDSQSVTRLKDNLNLALKETGPGFTVCDMQAIEGRLGSLKDTGLGATGPDLGLGCHGTRRPGICTAVTHFKFIHCVHTALEPYAAPL